MPFFHHMMRRTCHAAKQIYDRNTFLSERGNYKLMLLLLSFTILSQKGRAGFNNKFIIKKNTARGSVHFSKAD